MMKKLLVGLLILSQTAACAFPRPSIKADVASASKPKLPEKDQMLSKEDDPSILDVPISDTVFVPQSLEKSESLPSTRIEGFNAYEMRSSDALRLLLQDKKIPVIFDVGTNDRIVNAVNLSGSLESVLDKISHIGGVFYSFENGVLKVKGSRRFSVSLPPIQSSFSDVATVIKGMGATDVNLDNFSRSISFSASREVYDDVRTYLQKVRETRSMLVYESYFFEVTLNDDSGLGINFNDLGVLKGETSKLKFGFSNPNQASKIGDIEAYKLGTTYTSQKLNIDAVTNFLQTQGSLETLSKPTITVISGTTSTFRVGNTLRYISQTQTTAATTTTTAGTPANPTVTVTTDKLDLGLKVDLAGDFEEDTVFTAVKIELTNLTQLKDFDTGSGDNATKLALPQVNERTLETSVRVRPGDTILIAGIQQTRDSKNATGTPEISGLSAQTFRAESTVRSELVIVMRPRVIRFVPRSKMLQAGGGMSGYKSSEASPYELARPANRPSASAAEVQSLGTVMNPALSGGMAQRDEKASPRPLMPSNNAPQDTMPAALAGSPPIRNSLDGMVGLMNRVGN